MYTSRLDPDKTRFVAKPVAQRVDPEPVQVILPVPKSISRLLEFEELNVPVVKLFEPSLKTPAVNVIETAVSESDNAYIELVPPPPVNVTTGRTELLVLIVIGDVELKVKTALLAQVTPVARSMLP
jgi:hypothetical protein